ncbi:Eco57I restriction-modification methylase domain-containing protein [Pasteurella canis]|uniref:Eco57I restriction-modification methylase domain-containing protein n=1 Tax=Pasteurella canis TaxID=753 RepID=UPI0013293D84|nr:Eco57I restriction-modification methylase domain-containing protein [Pasteurella canis]MXN88471.1 N-6 DNA methylase [Pasteurella canis]UDW82936.1 SAM-dependent methyltransferase [Pasteurella canis]
MTNKKNETSIAYKSQVFTPENYVKELLDSVGYCKNIVNKTILENSCGDGNILVEVVKRYIEEAMKLKYSNEKIKKLLENNIYGFEFDKVQFRRCIHRLNLVTEENGIQNVKWKIYNEDYLKSELNIKFDFIVGNPPYITYSDLSKEERIFIRGKYETCQQGKFDYCYAFIEHSIKFLSNNGKMSYLIPSSIFKTVFGNKLREFIKQYIILIKDYTKEKIFDNALVKSSIIILDKNYTGKNVQYLDMSSNNKLYINKKTMKKKWIFSNDFNMGKNRFGDYFKVSHVVATLLNKAYVINEIMYQDIDGYYKVENFRIEKDIVMPTTTPRAMRYGKTEKIIFPYKYIDNRLIKYEEKEFEKLYPGAFAYLNKFKEDLVKRKSDSTSKWFEYGRSQALLGIRCEKLLISTIITDRVYTYRLDEECVPYGGMYISIREGNKKYDLDFAKKILESQSFINYVRKAGINISGNSLRITSRDIENFYF